MCVCLLLLVLLAPQQRVLWVVAEIILAMLLLLLLLLEMCARKVRCRMIVAARSAWNFSPPAYFALLAIPAFVTATSVSFGVL